MMDANSGGRELDARVDGLKLNDDDIAGIFAASDALASQYQLRMTLSDPFVPGATRAEIARRLFGERVSAATTEVVAQAAARARDSRSLGESVERLGVRATFLHSGTAANVQDEVFRFARAVEADSELQATLTDPLIDVDARKRLVAELLSARAHPATVKLAQRAVEAPGRNLVRILDGYVRIAAEIQRHTVAKVTVAQPLSADQRARLSAQLARIYGSGIDVQESVDPRVLGGVRIEVGDELLDGTILNRLNEARHLFVAGDQGQSR